jgi:hypothetical protein
MRYTFLMEGAGGGRNQGEGNDTHFEELCGFRWLVLNGLRYERRAGKVQGSYGWSGPEAGIGETKDGYYNAWDGVIFVNHNGKTHAAPHTPERETAVISGGFQKKFMQIVGLLDHERLSDTNLQAQFERL